MVEIITQWPGHAAEEIERLVTLPTEVEMNGVPKMSVMRSISLYGLSDVILTFDEDTDDYFARQVVFQRLSEVDLSHRRDSPRSRRFPAPRGLVYRYVIESPDRSPQELKTYEDWVIEREYKQVPRRGRRFRVRRHGDAVSGAARSRAAYTAITSPFPPSSSNLGINNANAGGGFYSQGGQFYYVRGIGLIRDEADIGRRDHRLAKRRAGARARRGRSGDRQRAAARRIRIQQDR